MYKVVKTVILKFLQISNLLKPWWILKSREKVLWKEKNKEGDNIFPQNKMRMCEFLVTYTVHVPIKDNRERQMGKRIHRAMPGGEEEQQQKS